jgi:uncharacterized membrane protein YhaH (DUF805 family)
MNTNDDSQPLDASSPTAPFRIVSVKGRIGRIRLIAYPIGLGFLISLPLFGLVSVADPEGTAAIAVITILGLVYLVMNGVWTVRRVQDFDGPMWLSAIFVLTMLFVPVVNLVLWFIPGTKGDNRYGRPPPPNSAGVYVLAFMMPVVVIVGIMAAVAIPAFFDYKVKAKLQEGVNFANAHRTALGIACSEGKFRAGLSHSEIACSEGKFRAGLSHSELGLAAPEDYSSEHVEHIAVIPVGPQAAEVVVTYREIGNAIAAGQTVVFIGTCRGTDMEWRVAGSVAEKFLPRI